MELPSSFYYTAGILVITNIGTIGTILLVGFRATWWLSKLDSRVEHAQDTANRAHKSINSLKEKFYGSNS